jgi:two-component system chemotaxis response regulator CheB
VREVLEGSEEGLQVIALVGSAGGLAAVSEVLSGLPADLNAAVIVLIHQAPERENKLVQILAAQSCLPVEAARDHTPLRARSVVVAPPGKQVLIAAGPMVRVIASGASTPSRPSADLLLATLATVCGPRATAVVLSGGGHDGATGATAVHHFGGTVLASDELTSQYFAMPQATIERDSVIDQIVPIGEIAALLVSSAPHPGESQKPAHVPDELVRVARERERVAAEREHIAEEREELAAERERLALKREHLTEGLERRGERLGEREAAVLRREGLADERERVADERERLADVRELAADERESATDRREGTSEQRELERRERAEARLERDQQAERRELAGAGRTTAATERREESADKREHLADERERLADEREGTAEQREVERRERAEAAGERERQAQRREQAQINREIAATGRELARDAKDEEAAQDSAGPASEHEGD